DIRSNLFNYPCRVVTKDSVLVPRAGIIPAPAFRVDRVHRNGFDRDKQVAAARFRFRKLDILKDLYRSFHLIAYGQHHCPPELSTDVKLDYRLLLRRTFMTCFTREIGVDPKEDQGGNLIRRSRRCRDSRS